MKFLDCSSDYRKTAARTRVRLMETTEHTDPLAPDGSDFGSDFDSGSAPGSDLGSGSDSGSDSGSGSGEDGGTMGGGRPVVVGVDPGTWKLSGKIRFPKSTLNRRHQTEIHLTVLNFMVEGKVRVKSFPSYFPNIGALWSLYS